MKNTRFEATIPSQGYKQLTEKWRSEGYSVLQNMVTGYDIDECCAVELLMEDIKNGFPNHEPLETATDIHGISIYVAAKCKIKKKEA